MAWFQEASSPGFTTYVFYYWHVFAYSYSFYKIKKPGADFPCIFFDPVCILFQLEILSGRQTLSRC